VAYLKTPFFCNWLRQIALVYLTYFWQDSEAYIDRIFYLIKYRLLRFYDIIFYHIDCGGVLRVFQYLSFLCGQWHAIHIFKLHCVDDGLTAIVWIKYTIFLFSHNTAFISGLDPPSAFPSKAHLIYFRPGFIGKNILNIDAAQTLYWSYNGIRW
jgi:hypothetical protein